MRHAGQLKFEKNIKNSQYHPFSFKASKIISNKRKGWTNSF